MIKHLIIGTCFVLLVLAAFGLGVSVGGHAPAAFDLPVAQAASHSAVITATSVAGPAGASPEPIDMDLFKEAWGLLEKQFYGDLPQGKEVTYDAIRGLVDRLDDKHTAFLDPEDAEVANTMMEGHFEGIGAQVEEAEGGGVLIQYLYPDQPAERAGLQVGDVVVAVDGKDVTGMGLSEAIGLIRGPQGTKVKLTVRREVEALLDVIVTRARIEIPVVTKESLANGRVVHISLNEFNSVAPGRLADALRDAVNAKPAGIVLDLRGNPGGFLDAAVRIGSYFVPEGPIITERFKDGTERVYQRQGDYMLGKTPLVVLVDAGSASASEIVAGAIQDARTGILMGEKTYGKGSVQLINSLSDGSQLRVTVARWFTPKGRGIHEAGLEPDIVVPLTKEDAQAKRDLQLDTAVKYLLGDRSFLTPTPVPAGTPVPLGRVTPGPILGPGLTRVPSGTPTRMW